MGVLYDSKKEVLLPRLHAFHKAIEKGGEALEQDDSKAAVLLRPMGSFWKWAGRSAAAFIDLKKPLPIALNACITILGMVVGGVFAATGSLPISGIAAALIVTSLPVVTPVVAACVGGVICGGATALNRLGGSVKASYDAFRGVTPQPPAAVRAAAATGDGAPVGVLQEVLSELRERMAGMSEAEKTALKEGLAQEFGLVSREDVVKADIADSASKQDIKVTRFSLRRPK